MPTPPQNLKILADVHIHPGVIEQLRERGIRIERVTDILGQDTPDSTILQYAAGERFTILTHDKRIQSHVNDRIAEGSNLCGVFIADHRLMSEAGIGTIIEEITFWNDALQGGAAKLENDVYNQIRWIV